MHVQHCVACKSTKVRHHMTVRDYSISQEDFTLAQCDDCGFRYTVDPPVEDKCGVYYKSDHYVSHSDSTSGFVNTVYHQVRKIMLNRKSNLIRGLTEGKTLLDVGSGTGYFPAHMQDKGYTVTAVEVDDQARAYSIKKFGLKVFTPDMLKTGNIKGSFSVITLWHVLEHLYDPDTYMAIFHNMLENDGHLIIAVPNFQSCDGEKYQQYWAGYDVPRHLWHFTPGSIEIFAKRNGFKIIRKEGMPFDPFYVSMLSEKYTNSSLGILRGGITGFRSLIKGWRHSDYASSVIYVMTKENT